MSAGSIALDGGHAEVQDPMPGVTNGKLAMWLFLVSDAMSFIGLLAAYVAVRWTFPHDLVVPEVGAWDPTKWFGNFGIQLTAFNTFVLICSSVTMVQGLAAFQEGNLRRGRAFLLATAFGGAIFLGVQAYEWTHMIHETAVFDADAGAWVTSHDHDAGGTHVKHIDHNLQAATFYATTGFHGCHVFGGVVLLLLTFALGMMGFKTWLEPNTIEVVGLYWHFVDLVWILIFTFVYLI